MKYYLDEHKPKIGDLTANWKDGGLLFYAPGGHWIPRAPLCPHIRQAWQTVYEVGREEALNG